MGIVVTWTLWTTENDWSRSSKKTTLTAVKLRGELRNSNSSEELYPVATESNQRICRTQGRRRGWRLTSKWVKPNLCKSQRHSLIHVWSMVEAVPEIRKTGCTQWSQSDDKVLRVLGYGYLYNRTAITLTRASPRGWRLTSKWAKPNLCNS